MSEITIGDMLSWEPGISRRGTPEDLERPLSWAVTIHATVPVLPPLRGGELIIAPGRTLDQLHKVEMIEWADIARSLTGQQIAGILADEGFEGVTVPDVPLFHAPATYILDAESHLNRTITEHRAELYRLGSDLTRALSAASMGGADLEALLAVAGDVSGQDLLLLDPGGTVLARSRNAPAVARLRSGISSASDWVFQGTPLPGGVTMTLAARATGGNFPEATRLVLGQTLMAIAAYMGPNGLRRATEPAPGREKLLADLLLGRVADADLDRRCRELSIDPDAPVLVALFRGDQSGFDGAIRTALPREVRARIAMLAPDEMAVLVPGETDWWTHLQRAARQVPGVTLVTSEVQPGMAWAHIAARQARTISRLHVDGNLARSTVFDVLLPLWDPTSFAPGPERLSGIADRMLLALEAHDRERSSDLVQTLAGYLAAGGSATGAAELLQIHRNTLGYRLRKITELTGLDLDDEDVRLAMGLALRIRQMQHLLG